MILFRLILESFVFAFNSLKVNKLRTILSLLGITVGIFAIISVFTVIDSMEQFIRDSLNGLGSNMIYVQKWPWTPPEGETEYPWWRYLNRPSPKPEEADKILRRGKTVDNTAFLYGFSRTIQAGSDKLENVSVMATSYGLLDVWNLQVVMGRYFTENEMRSGAPVTLIGYDIAEKLFPDMNPLNRELKIQGYKFRVIGVYEKKGQDAFGNSMDKNVHIPAVKSFYMVNLRNRDKGQTICVKAKPNADSDQFKAELEGIMRTLHRLKPMEENDFALNEVSLVANRFDQLFGIINIAGAVIGGFAILVGGFGIANIMFVSVKERTKIIGIQKSLGAKKYFILLQFIFEAIVLSLIGGIIGLIMIYIGTLIANATADFTIVLTTGNIIRGLLISSAIGFLAGFIPARTAAKLDPVNAMNSV
ncbi:MAG: ABC transporter [Draconibacterium sp.]|nr:MAG: ABC transporter [Draconibacterium sp.]